METMSNFDFPFNHWVIDRFIPIETVRKINDAWPTNLREQDKSTSKKYHTNQLDGIIKDVSDRFTSESFCRHLKVITGLDVIADETMKGGGLHEIKRGGFLKKHIDFNLINTKEGMRKRKLNVLLYLNENWRDEWGGHLELYDNDLNKAVSIAPEAGRLVIFETSDHSWHGHPEPLDCPENRSRRSMAFYYYSAKIYKNLEKTNTVYKD